MNAPRKNGARRPSQFRHFVKSTNGLVTVEWVALAAAMIVGAVSIGWVVMTSLKGPANLIGTTINGVVTAPTPPSP